MASSKDTQGRAGDVRKVRSMLASLKGLDDNIQLLHPDL